VDSGPDSIFDSRQPAQPLRFACPVSTSVGDPAYWFVSVSGSSILGQGGSVSESRD
jgi:hypothetical protein